MPEKDLIKEQLEKIRKFFERKYFKISELDKKQHRLMGKYERAMEELDKVRKETENVPMKEVRRYQIMGSNLKIKVDAIKAELQMLREMRLKIKLMDMEENRLRAELVKLEMGEE